MIESVLGVSLFLTPWILAGLVAAELIKIRSFFRKLEIQREEDRKDKATDGTDEVLWDLE